MSGDPQTPSGLDFINSLWDDPGVPNAMRRASEKAVLAIEKEAAEQEHSRIAAAVRDLRTREGDAWAIALLGGVLRLIEGVEPSPHPRVTWDYDLIWEDKDGNPVEPVAPPPGCQCPTFWHGILPPPCPVHNPTTPGVVTRTSANTGEPVVEPPSQETT